MPPEEAPPGGVNLVPTAPPSDIFRQPPPAEPPPPEEEPPAGFVSRGPTSGTASLAVQTLPAAYQTEGAAAAAAKAPPVRLWLAPARLAVAPGDTFEVRVQAETGRPVSHLPLSLSFDPAVLAVEKVDAGDFLGGSGEAQVMSDAGRPGALVIGASRLGRIPGVKGRGTVARITFRAVAAGSSGLSFEGKALDSALRPVAVRTRPALIEVSGEPEPHLDPPAPPAGEASAAGRR